MGDYFDTKGDGTHAFDTGDATSPRIDRSPKPIIHQNTCGACRSTNLGCLDCANLQKDELVAVAKRHREERDHYRAEVQRMQTVVGAALAVNSLPISTPRGERETMELRLWQVVDEYSAKTEKRKCNMMHPPNAKCERGEECPYGGRRT